MTVTALLLLAVGVVDLLRLALPAGRVADRLAAGIALAVVVVVGLLAGVGWAAVPLGVVAAAVASAWAAGADPSRAPRVQRATALGLLAMVLLAAACGHALVGDAGGAIGHWQRATGSALLAATPTDELLLVVALAVVLLETANVVVRLVLGPGDALARTEQQLRGGRLLGPLERLFILGATLAGDVTAVAAVIAAKSILRFPELSREARDVTQTESTKAEYVLVGSFVSWGLALAGVALVAGLR